MVHETCPICKYILSDVLEIAGDSRHYNCLNCGDYTLAGSALEKCKSFDADKLALMSYVIRQMQRTNKMALINSYALKNILENSRMPSASERADNLILFLGEGLVEPGTRGALRADALRATVGAITASSVGWLFEELQGAKMISGSLQRQMNGPTNLLDATLTLEGWQHFQRLKMGAAESHRAFMAMKFGKEDVIEAFNKCFKRATGRAGFDLIMLAESEKAGLIDDRMRVEIRKSRFIIADLTHGSNGAYWEAGYGEGLGKPVIYTCRQDQFEENQSHFDTNHHLTVKWNPSDLGPAEERLVNVIRATLPGVAKQED